MAGWQTVIFWITFAPRKYIVKYVTSRSKISSYWTDHWNIPLFMKSCVCLSWILSIIWKLQVDWNFLLRLNICRLRCNSLLCRQVLHHVITVHGMCPHVTSQLPWQINTHQCFFLQFQGIADSGESIYVIFEVFGSVWIATVCWVFAPCTILSVRQCFRENYCLL